MPKFVLPKALKERTVVINDRYAFIDGEMNVSNSDAKKLERILCRFHGCELVEDAKASEEVAETVEPAKPTLAAAATKPSDKKAESK